MPQFIWPTEPSQPQYVLHLFLQHDSHCAAIVRITASEGGLGIRRLRPTSGKGGAAGSQPGSAGPSSGPSSAPTSQCGEDEIEERSVAQLLSAGRPPGGRSRRWHGSPAGGKGRGQPRGALKIDPVDGSGEMGGVEMNGGANIYEVAYMAYTNLFLSFDTLI